jgi:hypothetical protein
MAYSNLDAHEGNTNTQTVIPLTRRSRHLQITNDSTATDLKFRFKESQVWATLHPTETVSMHVWIDTVYLSGANVPYRIWNYG